MIGKLAEHSEKLRYFFEVANQSSLHAASRKLGISAPSLSLTIQNLESVLNVTLFQRTSRGMTLTSDGKHLYTFCQNFFKDIEKLEKTFSQSQAAPVPIRIGTFQTIAVYLWPLIYKQLKKQNNIHASITTNRSGVILEYLLNGRIDLAITVGALKRGPVKTVELYTDEFAFFTSRKNTKTFFTAADLKELTLFYFPDAEDDQGRTLQQYIKSWQIPFVDESEIDSFEVISEFTQLNLGIGLLPIKMSSTYKDKIQRVRIEGIPSSFGKHSFYISYRQDLEIKKHLLDSILAAAESAVILMKDR